MHHNQRRDHLSQPTGLWRDQRFVGMGYWATANFPTCLCLIRAIPWYRTHVLDDIVLDAPWSNLGRWLMIWVTIGFFFFMLSWFNITYIATTSVLCSQGTCDFCHVSITFNIMVMFCQTLSRHRDLGRGELLLQTCWYHQPPVVRTTNGLALYFVATFTPSKRQFWDVRLGYILLLPDQSVLWLPLWVYTWQWILGEINQYHCGYKPCKLGYGCVRNMTALICI